MKDFEKLGEDLYLLNTNGGTTPDPQWQILTADDLRRKAQKGHQSLREKYGKG